MVGKHKEYDLFQTEEDENVHSAKADTGTFAEDLAGCRFKDARVGRRFKKLVRQLSQKIGQPIPMACQDWANTKAAYRFFGNRQVKEAAILAGHFQATRERAAASVDGPILILHDTTEFSFSRESPAAIGVIKTSFTGWEKSGRPRQHTVCGILMHSSLAVTTDGLPLGLTAVKFWTRNKFKGTNALKRTVNPTRVPIETKESIRWLENLQHSTDIVGEPDRCVHVGDRESDIYELFCTAATVGTKFVLRTCVDRLVDHGQSTMSAAMKRAKVKAIHRVEVRDNKGNISEARLEVKYQRLRVSPPIGKQKKYPPLTLMVIHAQEVAPPKGRERIHWKLITNLPIRSRKDALEKLSWYAMRWKIETFHKILKSGCKVEASKLRTAERIVNLIAIFCILSWRIFWMTMINRLAPTASPSIALTRQETHLLDMIIKDRNSTRPRHLQLSMYLTKIARLGGYLGRAKDSPPGNLVMWRGLSRLVDIGLGFTLARLVGN